MIALAAKAALIRRGRAWAVAVRGEEAVCHVLCVMRPDIDVALGLTSERSLSDVDRSALYRSQPSPIPY
jgi:isopentenyl diphosphate isomerase/L-lactate dehydrogenase-like FMN-dependent dehydrogenase